MALKINSGLWSVLLADVKRSLFTENRSISVFSLHLWIQYPVCLFCKFVNFLWNYLFFICGIPMYEGDPNFFIEQGTYPSTIQNSFTYLDKVTSHLFKNINFTSHNIFMRFTETVWIDTYQAMIEKQNFFSRIFSTCYSFQDLDLHMGKMSLNFVLFMFVFFFFLLKLLSIKSTMFFFTDWRHTPWYYCLLPDWWFLVWRHKGRCKFISNVIVMDLKIIYLRFFLVFIVENFTCTLLFEHVHIGACTIAIRSVMVVSLKWWHWWHQNVSVK